MMTRFRIDVLNCVLLLLHRTVKYILDVPNREPQSQRNSPPAPATPSPPSPPPRCSLFLLFFLLAFIQMPPLLAPRPVSASHSPPPTAQIPTPRRPAVAEGRQHSARVEPRKVPRAAGSCRRKPPKDPTDEGGLKPRVESTGAAASAATVESAVGLLRRIRDDRSRLCKLGYRAVGGGHITITLRGLNGSLGVESLQGDPVGITAA